MKYLYAKYKPFSRPTGTVRIFIGQKQYKAQTLPKLCIVYNVESTQNLVYQFSTGGLSPGGSVYGVKKTFVTVARER